MNGPRPTSPIVKLTGVYDANGSVPGEIAYWFGARLGLRHCSLCEITHGLVRPSRDWLEQLDRLPLEFSAVHLDEREPDVEAASRGEEPCVVATREDGRTEVVIDREQLDSCEGDPTEFARLLNALS